MLRAGSSRFPQRQIQHHRRLIPVADLWVRQIGMIGVFIAIAGFIFGLGAWLFGIRPYLSRHGGIANTGATYYLSAWADWQQCREFGRAKNDGRALALSRYFTFAQLAFLAGVILFICRI